ncbi:hypothetical protein CEB3_c43890 [Peptococcaceae bacterium CEB3]|nr:hypothetical protein CEB3_c43890 [Peptococcaceae bacterium CEB3]
MRCYDEAVAHDRVLEGNLKKPTRFATSANKNVAFFWL